MVERLLATCGKDAVWTLVERHADLDAELDRRAALPPLKRLQSIGLVTWLFVRDLARRDVLIGGAWAASLHGIPHEGDHGVLWCSGDEQAVAAFAALLQRHIALFYYDGQLSSPNIRPDHLRGPEPEWLLRNVGRFGTRLVSPGESWPREVRLDAATEATEAIGATEATEDAEVRLRVVPAEDLGPDDGVRPEVLARYLARHLARQGAAGNAR